MRTGRHAQDPADRLDPEAATLLIDEGETRTRPSVRTAQLEHLTPQLPDLLALLSGSPRKAVISAAG
jgi:hypothetical protein